MVNSKHVHLAEYAVFHELKVSAHILAVGLVVNKPIQLVKSRTLLYWHRQLVTPGSLLCELPL